jgi:hypothetical protein
VKHGWDLNINWALTGLSFRWHEAPGFPGKYQGYGVSFIRFEKKHGTSVDYIPNTIKPSDSLKRNLLLLLWEQKVDSGGVERKRWLAYAVLGDPTNECNPATGCAGRVPSDPDPMVTGYQGWPDGRVNDDASILVRIEEKFIGSNKRVNEIKLIYGDASPKFDATARRTADAVATNAERVRYSPEFVTYGLFHPPRWPANRFTKEAGVATWWDPSAGGHDAFYYDYFTVVSAQPKHPYHAVEMTMNNDADDIILLSDKCTIRTDTFTLDTYSPDSSGNVRMEAGLHAMGNLNDGNLTVAFDDLAVQILGVNE